MVKFCHILSFTSYVLNKVDPDWDVPVQYIGDPDWGVQYSRDPDWDLQYSRDPDWDVQYSGDPDWDVQYSRDPDWDVQYSQGPDWDMQYSMDPDWIRQNVTVTCRLPRLGPAVLNNNSAESRDRLSEMLAPSETDHYWTCMVCLIMNFLYCRWCCQPAAATSSISSWHTARTTRLSSSRQGALKQSTRFKPNRQKPSYQTKSSNQTIFKQTIQILN